VVATQQCHRGCLPKEGTSFQSGVKITRGADVWITSAVRLSVYLSIMINVLPYYDRIMKTSCYDYCIINYHLMKLVITRDISFMYTIHIFSYIYTLLHIQCDVNSIQKRK
jgi:hypothetical protein